MTKQPLASWMFGVLVGFGSIWAGCKDSEAPPIITADAAPIALSRQLVFISAAKRSAYLLDVGAARPSADSRAVALPPGASSAVRRLAHDSALVLCQGERGSATVDAEPAALVAIENDGKARKYELGTTPFNALTQSDDGRYAILYRNGSSLGRTLNNPNELVVVDLDKAPDDDGAITRKTPDGLGHTLTQVIVSPSMHIVDEDRRLLVILSAAEVTVFDLQHLDRRATIVSLDETREIDPAQLLFGAPDPIMYVRADASDNIFMFRFEPHHNDDPVSNDFRPTINPLSGGVGPRDMVLFADADANTRLLVVAATSGQALVIDPSSSKTESVKLNQPANHILLFSGTSPTDSQVRSRALLYADGGTSVTFFDPESMSDRPQDSLETLSLSNPIGPVVPLLEDNEAVLIHTTAVTIVNLTERSLTPIAASSGLTNAWFDPEHARLWIAPKLQPWVGTLDLATGRTDEVLLDADISGVVPVLDAGRVAVVHPATIGHITLLDLEQPTRQNTITLEGFSVSAGLNLED
jgi:hypothetical protein